MDLLNDINKTNETKIKDLEKQNHEIDILDAPDFACFLISNENNF